MKKKVFVLAIVATLSVPIFTNSINDNSLIVKEAYAGADFLAACAGSGYCCFIEDGQFLSYPYHPIYINPGVPTEN